jgi:hypothetical protein
MPYKVKKQGDKYAVYKKDTGKLVGRTAGNKEALRKYLSALHLNANESSIKLADLLKEAENVHIPYMYSAQGFSCKVCKYYYLDDGVHKCSSADYKDYKGTTTLVDDKQNPIKDPSKWCSDWFEPSV